MKLYFEHFDTPLGLMEVTATAVAVKSIHFIDTAKELVQAESANAITALSKKQLNEYFSGTRKLFGRP